MYSFKSQIIKIATGFFVFLILGYFTQVIFSTPQYFPSGTNFIVEEGESLHSISTRLEDEGYIDSALWFRAWVSFLGGDKKIQLGGYVFSEPHTLGFIVKKFISGKADTPLISVTIPEGSTSYEVAVLLRKVLPKFSIDIFGEKISAKNADGKLFPSTYFLLPSTTEEKALEIMTSTFEKKYKESFSKYQIQSPLKNREEVITLASILEGEAKTKEDMQIVSGILLKRLRLNMPLQVDVAPETYKTKGLPQQPISNPGEIALYAVFNPTDTPYLYYITGKDGTMHYAKTFEEHKVNIRKYLK